MRSLSLTMPAALLLLLCLSCNNSARKDKLESLSRRINDAELKSAAPATDHEAGESYKMDSATATEPPTTGVANTVGQAEDDQSSPPKPVGAQQQAATQKAPQQTASTNPDWDKKIIKTANLKLEVKNYRSFNELLHRVIKQSGGYIAQEEQSQSAYQIENTVSIKVPVAQFEETLSRIGSDSDKLVEKRISAEDVTMQVVDTKSRLETKREVRERYLDLLKQARNMNEILKVQNEINDIQEQMEGAAGRISYLGHAAAYSTINLNFYQVLDVSAKDEPEPSFLHRIKGALADGWNWISLVLIGLVGLWPLWMAVGLGWMGVRKWRTSLKARPAVQFSGTGSTGSAETEMSKE
ncbi:MAG TPA: DUF4349 domain-containing protein [Puia sp.]|nr:DUF4349 domain-containing protein [Puia sp.]